MKKQRKKYPLSAHLIAIALGIVAGAAIGFAIGPLIDALGTSPGQSLLILGAALVALVVVWNLTVVVHEAGHLVFGLATGWRFVSFRIGRRIFVRKDGKMTLRRYTIPGTGGQCLMEPPSDEPPYFLYNFGGPFVNLLQGLLLLVPASGFVRVLCVEAGALGLLVGVMNLIPFRRLPTDGGNLRRLKQNPAARRALVTMMRVNAILTRGGSMRDVPAEWLPDGAPADGEDPLVLSDYIAAADRTLALGDCESALARYTYLLEHCPQMYNVHKNEVACYALMLEYLLHGNTEKAKELDTKELRSYEKSTALYPSRAALAYARARANGETGEKELAAFGKAAAGTPYPGDAADLRRMLAELSAAAAP